jgi:hypothetical protein
VFRDETSGAYTVAVAWQGMSDSAISANNCGVSRYSSELRRRVVWITLKIATLL